MKPSTTLITLAAFFLGVSNGLPAPQVTIGGVLYAPIAAGGGGGANGVPSYAPPGSG